MIRWIAIVALVAASFGCAQDAGLENGSFEAELNGFRIHYEVHGKGPVVMTLPNSWGLSLEGLRAMYRPLEERVTMVYFDPRGMGGSDAVREDADRGMAAVREDFDALRRHLGLENVHAIGWSNGAINLIVLASERPETLRSAIFLHGSPSMTAEDAQALQAKHPDIVADFRDLRNALHGPDLTDDEKTARMKAFWLDRWFPASSADPEGTRARLRDAFGGAQFSWLHAVYAEQELPLFDFTERLSRISVPSLVLAGAHDMFPPAKAEALHEGISGSEYVLFESSGHFAPLEEPERFREAVFGFLGV